jgi:hypothetical protein
VTREVADLTIRIDETGLLLADGSETHEFHQKVSLNEGGQCGRDSVLGQGFDGLAARRGFFVAVLPRPLAISGRERGN